MKTESKCHESIWHTREGKLQSSYKPGHHSGSILRVPNGCNVIFWVSPSRQFLKMAVMGYQSFKLEAKRLGAGNKMNSDLEKGLIKRSVVGSQTIL